MRKTFSLVLILFLAASSLIIVNPAVSQTTNKPSVPEFTVSVTDHSYDVQTTTTTTTDFDGRRITTTTPGYHVNNGSIELSIKNQPFTSYYDSEGYPINLYYHLRVKLLDPVYWRYFPGEEEYFAPNNSTYTTVTYGYEGHFFVHDWAGMPAYSNFRTDGTIDFQVEAFIGHTNTTIRFSGAPIIRSEDIIVKYVGQTSGWSNTQTATIPNGAYTLILPSPLPTTPPTANPTSNPIFPNLTFPTTTNSTSSVWINYSFSLPVTAAELIIGALVGVIVAMSVALIYMKQKGRTKNA